MKKIKVLIADDVWDHREDLMKRFKDYCKNRFEICEIEDVDSRTDAIRAMNECSKNNSFYDLFFCDIDFTDNDGNKDDGYKLIRKSFTISPITKIITYSAQFRNDELWPEYEKLQRDGLVLFSLDKQHGESGTKDWYIKKFDEFTSDLDSLKPIWDLWLNHKNIMDSLYSIKDESNDKEIDFILSSLETIILLITSLKRIGNEIVIFRLIIHLYFSCLETYCRLKLGDDEQIKKRYSEKSPLNPTVEKYTSYHDYSNEVKNVSAVHILLAYGGVNLEFGEKCKWYRNESIHKDSKKDNPFIPSLMNVLYANLTLSKYILDYNEIQYSKIKEHYDSNPNKDLGRPDLNKLLNSF